MSQIDRYITGEHKTQLYSDALHAAVVLIVVLSVTGLALSKVGLPQDVIGTVYGGAIGYAAGRAGNIAGIRRATVNIPPAEPVTQTSTLSND